MSAGPPFAIVEADATPGGLALLRRFHDEAYVAQFPDADERESLAQMARYLRRKAVGWYGANNYHVLVALRGGSPVGGVVLDYLAHPNAGIVEFLFVLAPVRGHGLARRLLDAGIRQLRADARRQGRRLSAVAAEINDPFRRPPRPDNMDPFARAQAWARLGFSHLPCPYVQPALSPRQAAVDYLMLIVRPLPRRRAPPGGVPTAPSVAADWVRSLVAEYMRWAMRIDQPQRQPEYQRIDACLGQRQRVGLLPLPGGIDAAAPAFAVTAVDERHPDFGAVLALAGGATDQPGHRPERSTFAAALDAARHGGPAYHLWRIAGSADGPALGMASFFSLPSAGFGGYLVLGGALRGRGLLAPLIARIEACMMADGVAPDASRPGWFIECGEGPAAIFRRRGFADVPVDYRPPALAPQPGGFPPAPLRLLYKPFGVVYSPPALDAGFVRRALREILGHVYAIAAPSRHPCYRRACASLRPSPNAG